jgi:molecular chaperone GrpE
MTKEKKSQSLDKHEGKFQALDDLEKTEEESGLTEQAENQEQIDEVGSLRKELDETRLKCEEYLDGWQRSRAEFANYKKRIEREQAQIYQTLSGNILKRYLGIVDDLERALKNRPQDGPAAVWAEGIDLIYQKLLAILDCEDVKPIDALGQTFDPNLHEAISLEESDHHESGKVIEVTQQGYLQGDRVLRPASVRVAK